MSTTQEHRVPSVNNPGYLLACPPTK